MFRWFWKEPLWVQNSQLLTWASRILLVWLLVRSLALSDHCALLLNVNWTNNNKTMLLVCLLHFWRWLCSHLHILTFINVHTHVHMLLCHYKRRSRRRLSFSLTDKLSSLPLPYHQFFLIPLSCCLVKFVLGVWRRIIFYFSSAN